MTEEPVEVIQADRYAAALLFDRVSRQSWNSATDPHSMAAQHMIAGHGDGSPFVQALARHRLSHSAEKEALIEALKEYHAAVEELVSTWAMSNLPASFYPNGADDCDDDEDQDRWDRFVAARSTLLSMRNNGNG